MSCKVSTLYPSRALCTSCDISTNTSSCEASWSKTLSYEKESFWPTQRRKKRQHLTSVIIQDLLGNPRNNKLNVSFTLVYQINTTSSRLYRCWKRDRGTFWTIGITIKLKKWSNSTKNSNVSFQFLQIRGRLLPRE